MRSQPLPVEVGYLLPLPVISGLWEALGKDYSFFAYPADIRRVVYTTNAIGVAQPLFAQGAQDEGPFPDDAVLKLLYLALRNITRNGRCPQRQLAALTCFAIEFPERFPIDFLALTQNY